MFREHNINPKRKYTGDCVIRAIGTALNRSWDDVFLDICLTKGFYMKEMPSDNDVWSAYLRDEGFSRYIIPNTCPDCYTVKRFADDNPVGTFILGTGTHVIAVIDGDYYDTWDSGEEIPLYYYEKEN